MLKKLLVVFTLTLTMIASKGHAFQAQATGATVSVTYIEPSVNADGSPLDDLHHTSVYYQIGSAPRVLAATIPATSANGGGSITSPSFTIPVSSGQQFNATVFATATDNSGNESVISPSSLVRMDLLSPAPPQ